MNKRIKDKINDIIIYLEQLSKIKPDSFKEYKNYFKVKAACERYFEKIAEAVVDLANLTIREEGFQPPEGDYESFDILEKENIIDFDLSGKLKNMKGMRNILAHQYGEVDNKIVYSSIDREIYPNIKEFLGIISKIADKT